VSNTAERIIQASLELFAKKGFEATSIRDIALKVNINSATLYHYIRNKEDFLFSLMKNGLGESLSYAEEIALNMKTPQQQIASLIQMHVIIHGEKQLLTYVTDTEYRSLQGEHKIAIKKIRKEYEKIWTNVITLGIDEGIFNGVKDASLTAIALLEMCTGVTHWYSPNGRVPLIKISEEFVNMGLNLLGAELNGRLLTIADLELSSPPKYQNLDTNDYRELLKH